MSEYLAPGVYVKEVPFGSKPIEGVSTSDGVYVEEVPSQAKPIEGVRTSADGVYVEEVPFGSKPIEGVSTSDQKSNTSTSGDTVPISKSRLLKPRNGDSI